MLILLEQGAVPNNPEDADFHRCKAVPNNRAFADAMGACKGYGEGMVYFNSFSTI
jgi:hypothetical protein